MRVLVLSSFFAPAYLAGGPVQTLNALVRAAPDGVGVDVVTTNRDLGVPGPIDVTSEEWVKRHKAAIWYTLGTFSSVLRGFREASRRRPDIVYVNSFFDPKFSLLPQILARLTLFRGARILVAPRGELNMGALALRSRKKRSFLKMYRLLGFANRVIWHASTDLEADDIRREFGEGARIIVRQNDTLLPAVPAERLVRSEGPCRLVFASRLSEKKRLDMLLRALSLVEGDYSLRVVGMFEDPAYEKLCRDLAAAEPLRRNVVFVGSATRDRVLDEMADADAFVFPTAGENFGHVVAEALSMSCPVIASDHTPWSPVLQGGGGIVVKDDAPESYAMVIGQFIRNGEDCWDHASREAGVAFARWAKESRAPHLFELLLKLDGRNQ